MDLGKAGVAELESIQVTLKSRIRTAIKNHCREPFQQFALASVLKRPGFALHPEGRCRAGRLVLETYRCIRGCLEPAAFLAATAVELQMDAAYLFDNVADSPGGAADEPPVGEELAMAIALLTCGNAEALEAARSAESNTDSTLRFYFENSIDSCAGQYLDAALERSEATTTEEALSMTRLKSGSLGKLAAGFGARMATADPETLRWFDGLGFNLFTYAQLIDDLRDACIAGKPSDIAAHKKTVPLAFFYNGRTRSTTARSARIPDSEIRAEYESSGAELFTATVAEIFLNRSKRALAELETRNFRGERLGHFVKTLERASSDAYATIPVSSQ